MEQFTPVPPPEGWLLTGEWMDCGPAAVLVPLILSLAATLRQHGDECCALADRAVTLLRQEMIVFRPEGPPAADVE
jgi:hypothetical protein